MEKIEIKNKDGEKVAEVHEIIGEFESGGKWKWKLTYTGWFDKEPKYDLRQWSDNMEKYGKGVTLTKENLMSLRDILNKMEQ